MKSKKYFYDGDQIWESDETTDAQTLSEAILADEELEKLDEIIIGCWGESYDNNVQPLLDMFAEHSESFEHIKSLFVGDMTFEECEVSWIEQGDYSKIWESLPKLKKLTIKGANGLSLGKIEHDELEELNIICGGLPAVVVKQIAQAHLPRLKKLSLYLGVVDYGCDATIEDVRTLLKADFIKSLEYLELGNSEFQDEIVEEFLKSNSVYALKTLSFANGTLTDKGGQMLLDHAGTLKGLETLDLTFHYLSDEMMKKLEHSGIHVILEGKNDPYEFDDEDPWYTPMMTE